MQRAKERETMTKAQEETARREKEAKKSEEWHAPCFGPGASPADGVKVQYMPASFFREARGPVRMSFGGFNKEVERMNEESAERRRRAKAMAEAANAKNEDVTDAEMAASLGKGEGAAKSGAKSAASCKGGDGAKGFMRPPALEATRKRSGDDDNHERKKKKKSKDAKR